jgi:hypothetical protein
MIGNYATKALEQFKTQIKNYNTYPSAKEIVGSLEKAFNKKAPANLGTEDKKVTPEDYMELLHEHFHIVVNMLTEKVNWSLNKDAFPLLWHTFPTNDGLKSLRLPYPEIIVEYNFDYESVDCSPPETTETTGEARKRIIILTEVIANLYENGPTVDGFYLLSILKADNNTEEKEWCLSPAGCFISYESLNTVEDWFVKEGTGSVPVDHLMNRFFVSSGIFEMPKYFELFPQFCEELSDEIRVALSFLQIINCKNAPIKTILPSEKINKKRAKQGKELVPVYRTLKVTGHTSTGITRNGSTGLKKTHWRRGHIRNQPTAKGIIKKWIKPMIIGAGKADKPEIVLT